MTLPPSHRAPRPTQLNPPTKAFVRVDFGPIPGRFWSFSTVFGQLWCQNPAKIDSKSAPRRGGILIVSQRTCVCNHFETRCKVCGKWGSCSIPTEHKKECLNKGVSHCITQTCLLRYATQKPKTRCDMHDTCAFFGNFVLHSVWELKNFSGQFLSAEVLP